MIYTCCWWVNLIGPKRWQLTCFTSQAMASHKVNSTTSNPAMTTLTDSARKFIFYAPPGVYTIDQKTLTTGFVNVGENDGGDINSIDIEIRSGSSFNNEFVDKRPGLKPVISPAPSAQKLGSISGCVKEDTDNNDSGDTNLVGVLVTLYDHTSNVIATTTHHCRAGTRRY